MTKAFRIVLAVLAIAASSAASATTFNLGVMGPPAIRVFGNSFSAVGGFTDEYQFSLAGPADSFGLSLEVDSSLRRDIDLLSMSLWSGGISLATDFSPSTFSFSNLAAGSYSLIFSGNVTGSNGGLLGGGLVGYSGTFLTTGSASPASVPEPATSGLFGIGLLGLFYILRRKRVS